ncbi:MAG: sugar ABC transporter ATP-binding protein [Bacilli bacterium]|nr:sugar ABC transporter ATP-binding protein [Bacilli bacterium]MDD4547384.1 sugar ABC transporter ATP-binding protein [Bacilli bacterium]
MKVLMKNINKSFYGVPVLKNVNFELDSGEVHALVGENGAGKSTLMKILTGIESKNSGEIYIDGKEINVKNVIEGMKLNIAFLHQELNALPNMTIWENMFLGRYIKNKMGFLDVDQMKKIASSKLKEVGLDIDVDSLMGDIPIGLQQLIEIASALLWNKKTIILDEPTSALTAREIKILFDTINSLKKEGVSFIYITHRLEEIFTICDRVTVLRDGEIIGTRKIKDVIIEDIIKMMVGYEMTERYPKTDHKPGAVVLEINDLSKSGYYQNINFNLHQGEVLGFSGLMGSGRTEIMQTIFGIIHPDSGEIKVAGKSVKIKSPIDAKKYGIGYITENRKEEGIVLDFSVVDNMVLPNLKEVLNKVKMVDHKLEKELTKKYIDKLDIKTGDINNKIKTLSGGNQQKVVVGKWLATSPMILILDEPTRGVDVGAKYEIYEIINELKKSKVAIIMISSELPEVMGMSDRIAVMHEGKLKSILSKKDFNQEKIMTLSTGGK